MELILEILVNECRRMGGRAGVLVEDRMADASPVVVSDATLPDVFRQLKRTNHKWFKLRPDPIVFHFNSVTAKLHRPLPSDSGPPATHYLREYWVRAATVEDAIRIIAADLNEDGAALIDFEEPTAQLGAAAVPSSSGGQEVGVVERAGRIFYPADA